MSDDQNTAPGSCTPPEHAFHRRLFLKGLAAGSAVSVLSWGGLSIQAFAEQAKREQKHCILLWLCGAPSQFETWDPKPRSVYGGPIEGVPTKIPECNFSELLPKCAGIADRLAIVRSMKTNPTNTCRRSICSAVAQPRPPFIRPTLGSVLAQQLGQLDSPIPNFILLDRVPEGNEFKEFKAGDWAG